MRERLQVVHTGIIYGGQNLGVSYGAPGAFIVAVHASHFAPFTSPESARLNPVHLAKHSVRLSSEAGAILMPPLSKSP